MPTLITIKLQSYGSFQTQIHSITDDYFNYFLLFKKRIFDISSQKVSLIAA